MNRRNLLCWLGLLPLAAISPASAAPPNVGRGAATTKFMSAGPWTAPGGDWLRVEVIGSGGGGGSSVVIGSGGSGGHAAAALQKSANT